MNSFYKSLMFIVTGLLLGAACAFIYICGVRYLHIISEGLVFPVMSAIIVYAIYLFKVITKKYGFSIHLEYKENNEPKKTKLVNILVLLLILITTFAFLFNYAWETAFGF